MSSWWAHTQRGIPSSEPGTDFYCPIGTPVLAPDSGRVWGYGNSVGPATGRWVGIDFDNGMSFRALHLSRVLAITGGYVQRGQVIGHSGASGYGEEDWSWNVAETGGAHTHVTLWPNHNHLYGYMPNGQPYTIDFMEHAEGGSAAGGDATDFPTTPKTQEDHDMYARSNAGVPNSGIIIQSGVPPYSLPDQVYEATASALGLTPVPLEAWKYETLVREQWTAFTTAQWFANNDLNDDDVQQLADKIATRLGRPAEVADE